MLERYNNTRSNRDQLRKMQLQCKGIITLFRTCTQACGNGFCSSVGGVLIFLSRDPGLQVQFPAGGLGVWTGLGWVLKTKGLVFQFLKNNMLSLINSFIVI